MLSVHSGTVAKVSLGIEIIVARSLALLMCTKIMVSARLPEATAVEPTLNSLISALVKPTRVSEPTTK